MTTMKQVISTMIAASLLDENMVTINDWNEQRNKKFGRPDPVDELESLEVEYQLIQQKKSKLSRTNRDRVVYIVEHMEEIPDE